MQNVSAEAGVRQIRAVQTFFFNSRTDVGIFYLIILNCRTAHNFQPRKFVHKSLNSCIKHTKSRMYYRTRVDKLFDGSTPGL